MLSDRLPNYKPIIWSGWTEDNENKNKDPLNENKLLDLLSTKLFEEEDLEEYLKVPNPDLLNNLSRFFKTLFQRNKLLVLIFDDFEWNLEPEKNKYKIMPEPAKVLKAVVKAIENSETRHKIIITCRYKFDADILSSFYSQGLEAFSGSDLQKKLRKLENFNSGNLSEALIERALNLADGNPRLLEFLNNEILVPKNVEAKLTELEQSPKKWKYKIIWEELDKLIDEPLQQILSYCLVYELSVPMVALEAVCDSLPNYQQHLRRGLDLGLIEMSPEPTESNRVYRVSRILPHIIHPIGLPRVPQVYSLYRKAHEELHNLWGNQENKSEERWREIFRLLFADRNNPQRFREGFSLMLEFGWDPVFIEQLIEQLGQLKDELPKENDCSQLEAYLRQGDWKNADVETTWIFYLVYLHPDCYLNYEYWCDFCETFPSELFQEINELWVRYSNGHFGFSIQKSIWESIVQNNGYERYGKLFWDIDESELNPFEYCRWWGEEDDEYEEDEYLKEDHRREVRKSIIDEVERKFCGRVGWKKLDSWEEYNSINFSIEATQAGFLPYLATYRPFFRWRELVQPSRVLDLPNSFIYILLYMKYIERPHKKAENGDYYICYEERLVN